jgi:AcrR family transcriptional regulator
MTSQETRNRVLDAALRLFNEHGTAAVSTNHIAAEAGISPGNLYYHFRNKEAIIREILQNMFAGWGGAWQRPGTPSLDLGNLLVMLRMNFQLLWEYRFFYRESVALMMRDPELARRHAEMQQARLQQQEQYYWMYVDAGILRRPNDETAIRDLVRIGWILGTNWLAFLEAGGQQVTEERMREGELLILRLYRNYLTEPAIAELDQIILEAQT